MSAFNAAISALMTTMRRVKGQRATYTRGSSSVALVVVPARTEVDLQSDEGVLARVTADDFLIETAQLVIDGQRVKPQLGDRLTLIDGDTYELLEIPPTGCWTWSDHGRTHYRIHTRTQ